VGHSMDFRLGVRGTLVPGLSIEPSARFGTEGTRRLFFVTVFFSVVLDTNILEIEIK